MHSRVLLRRSETSFRRLARPALLYLGASPDAAACRHARRHVADGRDGGQSSDQSGARPGRTGQEQHTQADAASQVPVSPWDAAYRRPENAAQRADDQQRAATRMANLFRDDATRAELRQRGQKDSEDYTPGATLFLDEDDEGSGAPPAPPTSSSKFFDSAVDDDVPVPDGAVSSELVRRQPVPQPDPRTAPERRLEMLEQELLDDSFSFFPPVVATASADAAVVADSADAASASGARPLQAAKERYVPGQQIIPPGLTRYRVEVQYQGGDFDGWYKSTARRWEVVERLPDGTTRRRPATPAESGETPRSSAQASGGVRGVLADGMHTQYHARTILEDALAVAIGVPTVSVTAAVVPETGVSVRRLTCHVDLPSELEMQPRTILQRATLWLQSHHQPLAVLACHPCRNQDFHARHSGVRRVYCYRILNRIAPPLFDAGMQWHVDRHLDVARMQRFAAAMAGTHDYGYFADPKMANALRRAAATGSAGGTGGDRLYAAPYASREQDEPSLVYDADAHAGHASRPPAPKVHQERGLTNLERAAVLPTFNAYGQRVVNYNAKPREYFKARTNLPTVRTIDKIDVVRQEDEVLIWFVGQSFLRHQIRNMVSVLKASGHGLWDEQELQHAFSTGFETSRKKFRRERLPAAPAYGLTLWDVEYPQTHQHDYVPFVDSGPYEEVDIADVN